MSLQYYDEVGRAMREAREAIVRYFPQYKNRIDLDVVITKYLRDHPYFPPTSLVRTDLYKRFIIIHPEVMNLASMSSLETILYHSPKLWKSLKESVSQQLGLQIDERAIKNANMEVNKKLYGSIYGRLTKSLFHEYVHGIDADKHIKEVEEVKASVRIMGDLNEDIPRFFLLRPTESDPKFKESSYSPYIFLYPNFRNIGIFAPFVRAKIYVSETIEDLLRKICGMEYLSYGMQTIFIEEKFGIKKDKYLMLELLSIVASGLEYMVLFYGYETGEEINYHIWSSFKYNLPYFISVLYLIKNPFDPSIIDKKFEERIPKSFFDEYSNVYFNILKNITEKNLSEILKHLLGVDLYPFFYKFD